MDNSDRRSAFAAFLRAKRDAAHSSDYGISATTRRRTPGLRREEVAELADVGFTWYTWLEQGRDVRPSGHVLARIASALKLNEAETQHLFTLAGHQPEKPAGEPIAAAWSADDTLREVVAAIAAPAFVMNGRFDVLASNAAFGEMFGAPAPEGRLDPNLLRRICTRNFGDLTILDWEYTVERLIGLFRSNYGHCPGSPSFLDLIGELTQANSLVCELWNGHRVFVNPLEELKIAHRRHGELTFALTYFSYQEEELSRRLVVMTPQRAQPSNAEYQYSRIS
jgi:transcriptional regulator with XRE-family HTH domain